MILSHSSHGNPFPWSTIHRHFDNFCAFRAHHGLGLSFAGQAELVVLDLNCTDAPLASG
jgi:hypothetical protein